MELHLNVKGKLESEKFLSIIQLGIVAAWKNNIMDIEEAEWYLFNPFTVDKVEKYGIDKNVIDIIRNGCELKVIESLIPDHLATSISEIQEQIKDTFLAFLRVRASR